METKVPLLLELVEHLKTNTSLLKQNEMQLERNMTHLYENNLVSKTNITSLKERCQILETNFTSMHKKNGDLETLIKDNQERNEVSMKQMHDQFDMKINKFMDSMVMNPCSTDSKIFTFDLFVRWILDLIVVMKEQQQANLRKLDLALQIQLSW